jgi:hypothetical protein
LKTQKVNGREIAAQGEIAAQDGVVVPGEYASGDSKPTVALYVMS